MYAVIAAPFTQVPAGSAAHLAAIAMLFWSAQAFAAKGERSDAPADAASNPVLVAAADIPRPQLEVSATTVPRFDNVDANTQTARIDMRLLSPGRNGIGVALGMNHATGAPPGVIATLAPSRSVDLGLHWRHTFDSSYRFDVTAYRRVPDADAMSLIESPALSSVGSTSCP